MYERNVFERKHRVKRSFFHREKTSVALSSVRGSYYLQSVEAVIFRLWKLLSSDRGSYYLYTVEAVIIKSQLKMYILSSLKKERMNYR